MKIIFNQIPTGPQFYQEEPGWTKHKEPSFNKYIFIGSAMGLLLAMIVTFLFLTYLRDEMLAAKKAAPVNHGLVFLTLCGVFIVHELAHLISYPDRGLSSQSSFVILPRKMCMAAVFIGRLSKRNYMICLLAPIFVITVPLLIYCLVTFNFYAFVAAIANLAGAGPDIFGVILIARRIPSGAIVQNYRYDTYYKMEASF